MPQVTVYVRQSDLDRWKSIVKKSEWVSEHLSHTKWANSAGTSLDIMDIMDIPVQAFESHFKEEAIAPTLNERAFKRSAGFCKNGHAIPEGRSKCLGRGCAYA